MVLKKPLRVCYLVALTYYRHCNQTVFGVSRFAPALIFVYLWATLNHIAMNKIYAFLLSSMLSFGTMTATTPDTPKIVLPSIENAQVNYPRTIDTPQKPIIYQVPDGFTIEDAIKILASTFGGVLTTIILAWLRGKYPGQFPQIRKKI